MPWTPEREHLVGRAERVHHRHVAVADGRQPVVGVDGIPGVDLFAARRCQRSAWLARLRPSKVNGRVTTPMVSAPMPPGDAGHDGRAAGARAATLAGGGCAKTMSAPQEDLLDLLGVVLGGLLADLGVGAGTEAAGQLAADVA